MVCGLISAKPLAQLPKHEVGRRLERDPIASLRINDKVPQPLSGAADPLRLDIPSGPVLEGAGRQVRNLPRMNFRHVRINTADQGRMKWGT